MTTTLNVSTMQEALDAVSKHLATMPHRSQKLNRSGIGRGQTICAYRSLDGLKCAIGCLIDDNNAAARFDEYSMSDVGSLIQKRAIELPFDTDLSVTFLSELQLVHDTVHNWNSTGFVGHAQLAKLANMYGLKYTRLTGESVPNHAKRLTF